MPLHSLNSTKIKLHQGVRQAYLELIFRKLNCEEKTGIKIDGETFNNLRFADDIVLASEDPEQLNVEKKTVSLEPTTI